MTLMVASESSGANMLGGDAMLPDYLGRIKRRVDATMPFFDLLHNRMREDQNLYDNMPYDTITQERGPVLVRQRYHRYISSDPQTYADKVISMIAMASRTIKAKNNRETDQKREINQMAIDFTDTAFKMADEMQFSRGEADLKSQLAYFIGLRGWYAIRAVVRMNPQTNKTEFDVTPFDPATTVCGWDGQGLEWACNISYRTHSDLRRNHPNMPLLPEHIQNSSEAIRVYDYYDRYMNVVFTENVEIKAITPHAASPYVPVVIGYAGGRSRTGTSVLLGDSLTDGYVYVGESCYKRVREMYREYNTKMTMLGDLVERTADPSWVYKSQEGNKSLPENPTEGGHRFNIRINEDIITVPMPQLDPLASEYFERVTREIQRATLPITAFGESPPGASGYLFEQTTRQQFIGTLDPFIQALTNSYNQMAQLLRHQYATGYFPPINIPGTNDEYVSQSLQQADAPMLVFKPGVSRNWQSIIQVAQAARAPGYDGRPLLPLDYIYENVLEIDDMEGLQDLIDIEAAEAAMPEIKFYRILDAAAKRDDMVLVRQAVWRYIIATMSIQAEQVMKMAQIGEIAAAHPAAESGNTSGSQQPRAGVSPAPAFSPQGPMRGPGAGAASQQTLGAPPPQPIQQDGPLVPPGTPRPGVRFNRP